MFADPLSVDSCVNSQKSKFGKSSKRLGFHPEGLDQIFTRFDELPDSAYVRIEVVMLLFACSKATVWRWVKLSILPPPVKRGRISAWQVGSLRNLLTTQSGE